MSDTEGVLARIRHAMGELTPSERRVARSLLARGPAFGLESSSSLAKRIGVSGPTVSRFASKLGFPNYAAFQDALRDEVQARITSPLLLYPPDAEGDDFLGRLLQRSSETKVDAVKETLHSVPPRDIEIASVLLADSRRRVFAYGGRFSHVLARHVADSFQELRAGVRFVEPTARDRLAALAEVNQHTVLVVFDFRRYEHETNEFARAMQVRGARLVVFTDQWLSPLAEIAAAVLPASLGQPSSFDTLVGALALIEVLISCSVEEMGPSGRSYFEQFNQLVDEFAPSLQERAAADQPADD